MIATSEADAKFGSMKTSKMQCLARSAKIQQIQALQSKFSIKSLQASSILQEQRGHWRIDLSDHFILYKTLVGLT